MNNDQKYSVVGCRITRDELRCQVGPIEKMVVAITGFTEDGTETFEEAEQRWIERGYRVLLLNLPEHESMLSLSLARPFRWPKILEAQLMEIYEENDRHPFHIAGFSVGGLLMAHMWHAKEDLVRKIFVVNPAFRVNSLLTGLLIPALIAYYALFIVGSLGTALAATLAASGVMSWDSVAILPLAFLLAFLMRFLRVPKSLSPVPAYRHENPATGKTVLHPSIPIVVASQLLLLQWRFHLCRKKNAVHLKPLLVVSGSEDWVVPPESYLPWAIDLRAVIVAIEAGRHNVLIDHWQEIVGHFDKFFPPAK
jgi:alpha-beta hydrolase superfamily lysophospholipase